MLRRRKWQPTSVFVPGKSHGQKTLVAYSLWGHERVGHNLATKITSVLKLSFIVYLKLKIKFICIYVYIHTHTFRRKKYIYIYIYIYMCNLAALVSGIFFMALSTFPVHWMSNPDLSSKNKLTYFVLWRLVILRISELHKLRRIKDIFIQRPVTEDERMNKIQWLYQKQWTWEPGVYSALEVIQKGGKSCLKI